MKESFMLTPLPPYKKGSLPLRCPAGKRTRVVVLWSEHAHRGNLGGIRGADSICQADANKYGYTSSRGYEKWYAFLCTNTDGRRNLKDNYLSSFHDNSFVYSGHRLSERQLSQQRISSWFRTSQARFTSTRYTYSFNGNYVNEGTARNGAQWYDADGWTGCNAQGNLQQGRNCNEWRSSSRYTYSYNTEVDMGILLRTENSPCNRYFALPCISVRCY